MMQLHRQQLEEVFTSVPFPVHGLDDSWRDQRWAGGWGASGHEVHTIELGHGDPRDDTAPMVRVRTSKARLPVELELAHSAQGLAGHLWHEGMEHTSALRAPFTADDPTEGWAEMVLQVDGTAVNFRYLAADQFWGGCGIVGDVVVAIQARHVDPAAIHLIAIDDTSSYLSDDGPVRGL